MCSLSAGARCGAATCRAGTSVQMCPRGAETDRSTVEGQCLSCQLRFPAWPPLLMDPSQSPPPGPLYVDPAPCGLAALWPFTCNCVQSPCSPPSEPRETVPVSNHPTPKMRNTKCNLVEVYSKRQFCSVTLIHRARA